MTDNLTPSQRSHCMAQVRSSGTSLETRLERALLAARIRFKKQVKSLPGRPDFVIPRTRIAVFVDGDFWHGFRFPAWRYKVSVFWQEKIDRNRNRDRRVHQRLRRMGWRVVRVWQHQINRDIGACVDRLVKPNQNG